MEQALTVREIIGLAYVKTGATSSRRLAEYSKRYGHSLAPSTLNDMQNGEYSRKPLNPTIRALSFLSGVPENDVREAFGLPAKVGRPLADQLPPDVDELGPRPRAALVEMARVLLDLQRQADEGRGGGEGEDGVSTASLADLGIASSTLEGQNGSSAHPPGDVSRR